MYGMDFILFEQLGLVNEKKKEEKARRKNDLNGSQIYIKYADCFFNFINKQSINVACSCRLFFTL